MRFICGCPASPSVRSSACRSTPVRSGGKTLCSPRCRCPEGGIPVATVAIGKAGAKNAGYLAAQILAGADESLAAALRAERERNAAGILDRDEALQETLRGRRARSQL